MKKMKWLFGIALVLLIATGARADRMGVLISEPGGTPTKTYALELEFPDGTTTQVGSKTVIDFSALGGGDMSTTTWTSGGFLLPAKGGLGFDASSAGVDATEFGYLNNVTSPIQTQLNGKQATSTILADIAANLADPNAHRIAGWDDTDGTWRWLTIGSGLSYDHASHTLTATGATPSFDQITAGDSTGKAFTIGTGGSLGPTGTGTITATNLIIASEAEGDLLLRGASAWGRKAKGTEYYPLVAGATSVDYAQLTAAGIADSTITGAKMANNTVTATQLAAALSFADGDFIDLSAITMTGAADEGLALPSWANVTPATTTKYFVAWDTASKALKIQDGAQWYSFGSTSAPIDSAYLLIGSNDASLTSDRRFVVGAGLTGTDAGANSTYTLAMTPSTLTGNQSWSNGSSDSTITVTYNLSSGTDPVWTYTNGVANLSTGTLQAGGVQVAPLVSPSFTTPTLGVATATTVNKLTLTAPTTGATLTLADGSTLATAGAYSTTLTATGATNVTLPTSGTLFGSATGGITSATLLGALSDETGTGLAVFGTSPGFTTSILPATAGGATIGSTTAEWGNVYLTDAAVIYGQADQSNSLTSAATGWTANLLFTGSGGFTSSKVNAAGGSATSITASGTLGVMDGSDTFRGLYLNYTNANHTGTGNTVALIDVPAITGDANANFYGLRFGNFTGTTGAAGEVERAISIGTGFDHGFYSSSPVYVGDGTNGVTISAAGAVSFAGTAAITLPTSLTGVLRADSGVLSVDTDVTDLVSASSTTVAGKIEIATNAETTTGTDTARAVTPDDLAYLFARPFAIGATTPAAATFTTISAGAAGFAVDASGNVTAASFSNGTGTDGQRRIDMNSNTTFTCSGNQIYVLNNAFTLCENGTAKDIPLAADSITWTGATFSLAGVTNLTLPTAAPDAVSEIGGWEANGWGTSHGSYRIYDGTGLVRLVGMQATDTCTNGQVLKWNTGGTWTCEDDLSAGAPALNTVSNPVADTTWTFPAGNELSLQFTGDFTTGSQVLIQQQTGNPSGGVLFEVRGTDTDPVLAKFGDGTNGIQITPAGAMTATGTGSITATALTGNVSGAASESVTTYLAVGADPADTGAIRLPNAGYIYSEASPAGTDVQVIGVDSGEIVQIAGSGASSTNITGNTTVTSGSFGLTGNLSAAAWTTSGIRYKNVAATLTDTSSSGTVAAAYTNAFGGNTIAASNTTTFTDYVTMAVQPPSAGTNVTMTRPHSFAVIDSTSAASSITGGLVVAAALGTSATSVGIGGGNVNAGGTVTAANVASTNPPTINGGTLAAGAILTGLSATAGALAESDSILTAFGKLVYLLTLSDGQVFGRYGGTYGGLAIDADLSSVSTNDDTVPSAKATKAMGDLKAALAGTNAFTGQNTLGDGGDDIMINLGTNATDAHWSGTTITATVKTGSAAEAYGQAMFVNSSGELEAADADVASAAAMPAVCLLIDSGEGASKKCLITGTITETDWNWTVGGIVYVSTDPATTTGLTQTRPATSGNFIQRVGIALSADTILVMPSLDVGTAP